MNQALFEIAPLREHPQHIPELARWHHQQWASLNPGETLASRQANLEQHAGNKDLPLTWVATRGAVLLGSASLVENDMEIRPDYRPWLASVFVLPQHRNHGIGTLLVEHITSEARKLGHPRLFLFTPDQQAFYRRLGWTLSETVDYHQATVALMSRTL
jgi:GNAT superfamily N-acetyltransferase